VRRAGVAFKASGVSQAHGVRALKERPRVGGRGERDVGEPHTRSQHRSETHLSVADPPAPVLADRRHTLRKKLRLYCMPKRLHRCLGAIEVRVAFKGGQSLDATSHRDTALSQFGPGGRCTGWRCSPLQSLSWRMRAPQRRAASETREGGTVGDFKYESNNSKTKFNHFVVKLITRQLTIQP